MICFLQNQKTSGRKDLGVWKLSGFSAPRCGGQRSPWAAPGESAASAGWDMDHDPPGYGGGGVFFPKNET